MEDEAQVLTVERIKLGVSMGVPRAVMLSAVIESELDFCTNRLTYHLSAYMNGGLFKERIQIDEQWPLDWWQAVRERWFPSWWLARWPVKYRSVHVDRPIYAAVCPHLDGTPQSEHVLWMFSQRAGLEVE